MSDPIDLKGVELEEARANKACTMEVFRELVGEEVAVGLTRLSEDHFGLVVNLEKKPDEAVKLPSDVNGVPVRIEVIGRIRKQNED